MDFILQYGYVLRLRKVSDLYVRNHRIALLRIVTSTCRNFNVNFVNFEKFKTVNVNLTNL